MMPSFVCQTSTSVWWVFLVITAALTWMVGSSANVMQDMFWVKTECHVMVCIDVYSNPSNRLYGYIYV